MVWGDCSPWSFHLSEYDIPIYPMFWPLHEHEFQTPGHPPLLPTIGTQGDLHRHGDVLEIGQILLGTWMIIDLHSKWHLFIPILVYFNRYILIYTYVYIFSISDTISFAGFLEWGKIFFSVGWFVEVGGCFGAEKDLWTAESSSEGGEFPVWDLSHRLADSLTCEVWGFLYQGHQTPLVTPLWKLNSITWAPNIYELYL